ncbi:MAG: hypothetical protein FWF15_00810 [Oscillospiraceae bacterium]|nr:hypothetical protein [Oscillospiraceae bacterium]
MEMKLEASDLSINRMEIEPRWLLCINCFRGGGNCECIEKYRIAELYQKIDDNPDIHLTLRGAFDDNGGRTERFYEQTPDDRRKDLNILQRLGLNFGDTRSARDLFVRLDFYVKNLEGLCRYPENPYGKWPECELADGEFYVKGNRQLHDAQNPDQMAAKKCASCKDLAEADHVVIRSHHLLCVTCFAGRGKNTIPLEVDNLMEAWNKFCENPDIPVTLVEGPGECCICPPCYSYAPSRGLCVSVSHIRDRKKDLDTFAALGVNPGETLTARELYKRIAEMIPDVSVICNYETNNSFEWTAWCNGKRDNAFEEGLKITLGYLGLAKT